MSVTVKEENLKEIELRLELEPVMRGELQTAQYVQIGHKEPVEGVRRFVPTRLFGVLVLLPLIGGFIYNFMIASDRYESVASFVVRETKNSGDLVSMLQGGGLTRSDDNSFAVTEYIRSRDAVAAINRDGFVTQVFAGDGLDPISRFPNFINGQSGEDLFEHFQRYVDVTFDTATGITTLSVQAFTPEQAQELARRLVKASEELVNGLNGRAQSDSTRFAEKLAVDSQAAMLDIQKEITAFRNENRILNADAEVTVSSGLIAGVLEALTRVNTEIAQQIASAPGSPRMTDLMLKRDALVEQLEKLRNEMVSGDGSIAQKLERFETLAIRQKIAQSNLISAETTLMKARQDAATEKLYLDNVVAPNLPDKVTYPEAYKNMLLILFISLSVFNIIRSLRDLIMEEN